MGVTGQNQPRVDMELAQGNRKRGGNVRQPAGLGQGKHLRRNMKHAHVPDTPSNGVGSWRLYTALIYGAARLQLFDSG